MRVLLVAVLLAMIAAGGCSGDRVATPDQPPPESPAAAETARNGPLVFLRPVGEGSARRYELLAVDAAGTPARRFADRLFPGEDVAVSPDGQTVAFTRPAGTGPGAWRLGTPHDVYLAPAHGGEPRSLDRTGIDERAPRFSADGRWIAFAHSIGMETARIGVTSIDDPAARDAIARNGEEYGGFWAPDGHRFVFSHGSFLSGRYDLYVADADTGEVTRIPDSDQYEGAIWAPTGDLVATTFEERKGPDETSIWTLAPDGSNRRLVATTSGTLQHGLAVAPNGKSMALGLTFGRGNYRVVPVPLGEQPVDVRADKGVPGWSPLWSPDGTTIAFLRGRGVWRMDADGSNPRRVENSEGNERLVAWLAAPAG